MGRRCVIAPRCVGQRGGARNELRPGRANTGERERAKTKTKNTCGLTGLTGQTHGKVKVPVKTNTDSSKQPKSAIHPYLMHRIVHCQCNFIHSFKKNMIHSYSCHESLQLIGIRIFPPPPCNPLDMNAAQASYCTPCWSEIGFRPPLTGVDSGFVCFFTGRLYINFD